ncbi:MAG: transcriptional repressor [Dehalococcoidales bacterium]|nr:MAG: transcriptional repressor [Dehalococcoidales bacterium]
MMNNKSAHSSRSRRDLTTTGLRATSQRAIILDIIRKSESHLDVDEIYRRARKREPRISLSTVYRSLHRFKEMGLVEEHHFGEHHHHYEVKPTSAHHHLMCLSCGRVIEFDYDLSRQIMENVPETREFEITETELRMTGYCHKCRKKGM